MRKSGWEEKKDSGREKRGFKEKGTGDKKDVHRKERQKKRKTER